MESRPPPFLPPRSRCCEAASLRITPSARSGFENPWARATPKCADVPRLHDISNQGTAPSSV